MMIDMQIRVTPTFRAYRGESFVGSHGGISETNLHNAVKENLLPHEAGYTPPEPAAELEQSLPAGQQQVSGAAA